MRDPHLEDRHRELWTRADEFGERHLRAIGRAEEDPGGRAAEVAALLAGAGLLQAAVPPRFGTADARGLVVLRERLAYFSLLAESVLAAHGLAAHLVAAGGAEPLRARWLPALAAGTAQGAVAVSEPEAGSDLGGARTRAVKDGDLYRLTGLKTYISNAGIAGLYTVLARTDEGEGTKGLSMFLVDGQAPGLVVKPLEPMAPHPLGEVRFDAVPGVLLGTEGQGYKLALGTLDTFRPSVGAAACGLALRARDEALRFVQARRQFGRPLSEFQATQMALADMQVEIQGARLLVRHAAWLKDTGAERIAAEGALAKLQATEMAQRVVDRAVQLHGGLGVMKGATVERLYREVRSLRIYEGTSEIQRLVIARELLKEKR